MIGTDAYSVLACFFISALVKLCMLACDPLKALHDSYLLLDILAVLTAECREQARPETAAVQKGNMR